MEAFGRGGGVEAFGRGGGGSAVPGRYSHAPEGGASAGGGMRRGAFDGVDPWNEF